MKIFFIGLAFLGGFLSSSTLLGMGFDFFVESQPKSVSYDRLETKQIYLPWLSCNVEETVDITQFEEHAKACFAVNAERIKMIHPSI